MPRGVREARARILLGLVADPQLDRVQTELDRELVDRRLQGEGADRLAGCAHERVGEHVHVDDLLVGLQRLGRVHVPRRECELLGKRVVRGHGRDPGVDQRLEPAVVIGADGHSLLGVRATADQPVDALSRKRDPHRTSGELRRGCREQMVRPQRLAAEAATDIRGGDVHLLLVDAEDLRERPGVALHALAGVVNDELVAVPAKRDRMRLDRVVIVARRPVGEIDGVGRVDQGGLGIAHQHLDWLPHETVGRPWMRSGLLKSTRRRRLVRDVDQRRGVVGLLLCLGQDDRDRLTVPMNGLVLHHGQVGAPGRFGAGKEQRRRLHARRVAVGHDKDDAVGGFGGGGVERGDASARDRAVTERRVDHAVHHVLGGEARRALDLERPVQA